MLGVTGAQGQAGRREALAGAGSFYGHMVAQVDGSYGRALCVGHGNSS